MKRITVLGAFGTLALLVAAAPLLGCASDGQPHQHQDMMNRIDELNARVSAVEKTSQRALARSEEAEAQARAASQRADQAARTAEKIFTKSVSK